MQDLLEDNLTGPRYGRGVLEIICYAALALCAAHPIATHFLDAVPLGSDPRGTVPFFNLWTLWWNVDRIGHLYHNYWNAPIFYPTTGALAFSEPLPLLGLMAWPLQYALPTPAGAYNALVVLSLTLNGWFTCRLLKRIRLRWPTALAGGAMLVLLPMVYMSLGVLQLIPLWGIIWTMDALYGFGRGPSTPRALLLGVAFSVTYLLCCNMALFFSVLLLVSAWWLLGANLLRWATWRRLATAVMVCVVVLGPVVFMQHSILSLHDYRHSDYVIRVCSAQPGSYMNTPWRQIITIPGASDHDTWTLSPGTIKIVFAGLGLFFGLYMTGRRRFTLFCCSVLVAATVFSLGPNLATGPFSPYRILVDLVPGFRQIRSFYRFAFFFQICIAMLAALGLHGILTLITRQVPNTRAKGALVVVFGLLGAVAVGEAWPPAQRLDALPSWEKNRGWIEWLQEHTPDSAVIAFVPFPKKRNTKAYYQTTQWMYWQTMHGRRMVNGYSGFLPAQYLDLERVMRDFPHIQSIHALRRRDVRFCVVTSPKDRAQQTTGPDPWGPHLHRRYVDKTSGVEIYEIR